MSVREEVGQKEDDKRFYVKSKFFKNNWQRSEIICVSTCFLDYRARMGGLLFYEFLLTKWTLTAIP